MGVCCEKNIKHFGEKEDKVIARSFAPDEKKETLVCEDKNKLTIILKSSFNGTKKEEKTSLQSTFIGVGAAQDNTINNCLDSPRLDIIVKEKGVIHISIYGSPRVGKSTFVERMINGKIENYSYIQKIYTEIIKTTLSFENHNYTYYISIPYESNQIINADCYFLIFDLSNLQTFFEVETLLVNKIKKYSNPVFLIGNNQSQNREVSQEKIDVLCTENHCLYFEFSSINDVGLNTLIEFTKEILFWRSHVN